MRQDQLLFFGVNAIVQLLLHFTLEEVPLLVEDLKELEQLRAHVKQFLQALGVLVNLLEVFFDEQVNMQLLLSHFLEFKVDIADVLIQVIKHLLENALLGLCAHSMHLLNFDQLNLVLVFQNANELTVDLGSQVVEMRFQIVCVGIDEVAGGFQILLNTLEVLRAL